MAKSPEERRRMIKRLVTERSVETQSQLLELLEAEGIEATQATVSRDIRLLGLVRVTDNDGRHHYAMLETPPVSMELLQHRLLDTYISVKARDNWIILKLLPGNAQSIAWLLDNLPDAGILGTIAGDDTILVIMDSAELAQTFCKEILGEADADGESSPHHDHRRH